MDDDIMEKREGGDYRSEVKEDQHWYRNPIVLDTFPYFKNKIYFPILK